MVEELAAAEDVSNGTYQALQALAQTTLVAKPWLRPSSPGFGTDHTCFGEELPLRDADTEELIAEEGQLASA